MSGGTPCEAEILREATRILRRLQAARTHLAPLGGGYAIATRRGIARKAGTASAEIVREFLHRDWLRARGTTPQTFALSDAGAGWLKRGDAKTDPFAEQHQQLGERAIRGEDGRECIVTFNDAESPLSELRRRGMIDLTQFEAGERLRRDFTMAQLNPRLAVDWTALLAVGIRSIKGPLDISDTALAAKQRFTRAMVAVGPGLSDLLFDVCCHLIGLGQTEMENRWPRSSAKVVLCIALDCLARHYGFLIKASAPGRMRSWQADEEEPPSDQPTDRPAAPSLSK